MMKFESGLYSLMLSLMLGMAPAWADVDISSMDKVEVGTWGELKAAVEDSDNAGKVIVLTGDIQADKNNPIRGVGGKGIIIDGGGHTITGQEGSSNGQFINFDESDTTDLIIQNVKIEGFGTSARGGAIYSNGGAIGDIKGDFTGNYAQGSSAQGGAIYNSRGTIGDITGDFIGNYAQSTSVSAEGGAIYNSSGTIGDITGDFTGNNAQSTSDSARGGAIYSNGGAIGDIKGDFTGNYAQGSSASGGAIHNSGGPIGDITGDFSDNYAQGSFAGGGAIYNIYGTIGDIKGNFSDNYAQSTSDSAQGGAIYNHGYSSTLSDITGDFSGNYAQSTSDSAQGGAIYNQDHPIGNITGDFEGNYAQGHASAQGGAIYNYGYRSTLSDITGDFSGNYAQSTSDSAQGGAIYNYGMYSTIGNITGDFSGNYAESSSYSLGGAIYTQSGSSIKNITGNFKGNYAISMQEDSRGGAIYNKGTIGNITGDFSGNFAKSDSYYTWGGAIYNSGTMTLVNSSFYDNYVQTAAEKDSTNGQQTLGGAIYSTTDLTIKADNGESIFRGNKVIWSDGEDSSAIYLAGTSGNTLNLDARNNGLIEFDDKISAAKLSTIVITGDNTGNITFNNLMENFAPLDVQQTNVNIKEGAGTVANTTVHDDGVFNVLENAKAEDNIINDKGTLNVKGGTTERTAINVGGVLNVDSGLAIDNTVNGTMTISSNAEAQRNAINDGGVLNVAAGGLAQDTTVNSGGTLSAEAESRLNNILANGGAILDIDSGAVLTGNIIIHADAEMGGTYDYSQIFKDEVTEDGSLTLVGGLNGAMTESSLINTTDGKRLHLTGGDYVIGDGAQAVKGWDLLTFKDNANVKLEGDITLTGPNKKLIIEDGSELNLAGHSPSNYTITGSVSNDGSMTFTHAGDDADDITTIYGNYTAYNNAQMTIDVNPTDNTSDLLRIDGDVAGTTTVNLNFVGADVETTKMIPFVEALNDDTDTGAYFIINRVYTSAFTWNSLYKDGIWYVGTDNVIPNAGDEGYGNGDMGNIEDDADLEADAELPDGFPDTPSSKPDGGDGGDNGKAPSVVGEAIAYMGLPSAGIEQTRGMTRNVAEKVAATKVYSKQCNGFYDCQYDGKALRNAWAAPVYSYSDVKAPYSYEAEISGFEGGFDVQSDVYNRLGVFASYRQGSYDFDGDGDDYYSKTGADMDIDSYILGLYHRYDEGRKWMMSQIFLGYQDVSMSSYDGVSSSTDGIEFGAAIEGGLIFNPMTNLTIEPIIRLAYTQINYDDASDAYGKTASYGDVRNIEVEAGVKVEKTYLRKNGYAKVYVKPSIIQNIGSGDVQVTSLRQVDGLENSTLGRIEVGGSMSFDERWSGYANAAYTFGSDYTNAAVNAGLNYAF